MYVCIPVQRVEYVNCQREGFVLFSHIGLELVHRFDKIVRAQNCFFQVGSNAVQRKSIQSDWRKSEENKK